jgi:hypothetical protein
MNRKVLALILISAFLQATLVGVQTIKVVNANFYAEATTPPPQGTIPPTITIINSENQKITQLLINITSASTPT